MEGKKDYIAEFIEKKNQAKELDDEIRALEVLILNDPESKNDERITIIKGRETYTITDYAYEGLEMAGISIEVQETRKKKLNEFDIDVQKLLLSNSLNYELKTTKESIRVKSNGKQ